MTLDKAELKPKDNLKLKIQSKKHSSISLLAIDKRITFLATGNDFNRSSIGDLYSTYEKDLHVIKDNLDEWSTCTDEENKILAELNKNKIQQRSIFQSSGDNVDNESGPIRTNQPEYLTRDTQQANTEDDNIRDYFPETWIFETIDMAGSDVFDYQQKVPDSITSWIITAFSINEDHGIALAKPIELIVKQEFFMKLNVPSFVRVGEVIKVDVIVFNYLKSKERVEGMVDLNKTNDDGYMIVKKQQFGSGCETFSTNDTTSSVNFSIASEKSQIVSFYVLAVKSGSLKLRFRAITGDASHMDAVHRTIIVEPEGIVTVIPTSKVIQHSHSQIWQDSIDVIQTCLSSDLTISGDFIANSVEDKMDK